LADFAIEHGFGIGLRAAFFYGEYAASRFHQTGSAISCAGRDMFYGNQGGRGSDLVADRLRRWWQRPVTGGDRHRLVWR
jgi:hypothetical protein